MLEFGQDLSFEGVTSAERSDRRPLIFKLGRGMTAAADLLKLKVRVIDFYDAVAAEDDVAFGDDENRVSIRQKGTATGAGLGLPFAKIF